MDKLNAAKARLEQALKRLEQVQKRHLEDLAAFRADQAKPAGPEWEATLAQLQSAQKEKLRLEALQERLGGRLDELIERVAALVSAVPPDAPRAANDRARTR